MDKRFDVIVVGGGHAGVEASAACARMGCKTLLVSLTIEKIALTPCNPAIGGSAKGIAVKEIDALGGVMGFLADQASLQTKYLNLSRGPAVHSLRGQIDKIEYPQKAQKYLLNLNNLTVIADLVKTLIIESNKVVGIKTLKNGTIKSNRVILTTGTYMRSITKRGKESKISGPDGQITSSTLSEQLKTLNIKLHRLSTGTPARIAQESINYEKCTIDKDLDASLQFSHFYKKPVTANEKTYLTYTNEKTHNIIKKHLHESASIQAGEKNIRGPRYCPSIEKKVMMFKNRDKHQIFIEPESKHTNSMYLAGLATTFSEKLQAKIIYSVKGLENCKILKYGYLIEYDAIKPSELKITLELKKIKHLYSAGQVNGTSGYEEAGAQGLIAGINCASSLKGLKPLVLGRNEAHIGVMVDDIITKHLEEPYRLLTSLAEFRLLLRDDNACERLIEYGKYYGLINDYQWNAYQIKKAAVARLTGILKTTKIDLNNLKLKKFLKSKKITIRNKFYFYNFLQRPEVTLMECLNILDLENEFNRDVIKHVEAEAKLSGYIEMQQKDVRRLEKLNKTKIPLNFNFADVENLSKESVEKLNLVNPVNLGQAKRIIGIRSNDVLNIAYALKKLNF